MSGSSPGDDLDLLASVAGAAAAAQTSLFGSAAYPYNVDASGEEDEPSFQKASQMFRDMERWDDADLAEERRNKILARVADWQKLQFLEGETAPETIPDAVRILNKIQSQLKLWDEAQPGENMPSSMVLLGLLPGQITRAHADEIIQANKMYNAEHFFKKAVALMDPAGSEFECVPGIIPHLKSEKHNKMTFFVVRAYLAMTLVDGFNDSIQEGGDKLRQKCLFCFRELKRHLQELAYGVLPENAKLSSPAQAGVSRATHHEPNQATASKGEKHSTHNAHIGASYSGSNTASMVSNNGPKTNERELVLGSAVDTANEQETNVFFKGSPYARVHNLVGHSADEDDLCFCDFTTMMQKGLKSLNGGTRSNSKRKVIETGMERLRKSCLMKREKAPTSLVEFLQTYGMIQKQENLRAELWGNRTPSYLLLLSLRPEQIASSSANELKTLKGRLSVVTFFFREALRMMKPDKVAFSRLYSDHSKLNNFESIKDGGVSLRDKCFYCFHVLNEELKPKAGIAQISLFEQVRASSDRLCFVAYRSEETVPPLRWYLVQIDLEQTANTECGCGDPSKTGNYYVHFFSRQSCDRKKSDADARWWPQWHYYTTGDDGVIEYGHQALIDPDTTPDPEKFIAWADVVNLHDPNTFLQGPFDFQDPSLNITCGSSFREQVPTEQWEHLAKVCVDRGIPPPNLARTGPKAARRTTRPDKEQPPMNQAKPPNLAAVPNMPTTTRCQTGVEIGHPSATSEIVNQDVGRDVDDSQGEHSSATNTSSLEAESNGNLFRISGERGPLANALSETQSKSSTSHSGTSEDKNRSVDSHLDSSQSTKRSQPESLAPLPAKKPRSDDATTEKGSNAVSRVSPDKSKMKDNDHAETVETGATKDASNQSHSPLRNNHAFSGGGSSSLVLSSTQEQTMSGSAVVSTSTSSDVVASSSASAAACMHGDERNGQVAESSNAELAGSNWALQKIERRNSELRSQHSSLFEKAKKCRREYNSLMALIIRELKIAGISWMDNIESSNDPDVDPGAYWRDFKKIAEPTTSDTTALIDYLKELHSQDQSIEKNKPQLQSWLDDCHNRLRKVRSQIEEMCKKSDQELDPSDTESDDRNTARQEPNGDYAQNIRSQHSSLWSKKCSWKKKYQEITTILEQLFRDGGYTDSEFVSGEISDELMEDMYVDKPLDNTNANLYYSYLTKLEEQTKKLQEQTPKLEKEVANWKKKFEVLKGHLKIIQEKIKPAENNDREDVA